MQVTKRPEAQSAPTAMDQRLREIERELRVAPDDPTVDHRIHRLPGDPHERASTIIARAHAEAARIVGDAAERAAALGREIERLQKLRDELDAALPDTDPIPSSSTTFSGEVALSAGPFTDIATLGEFEIAVANVPGVTEARVRGFEGDHAVLDVTLSGPSRLIEEMERALPWDFLLERSDGDSIAIRLLEDS